MNAIIEFVRYFIGRPAQETVVVIASGEGYSPLISPNTAEYIISGIILIMLFWTVNKIIFTLIRGGK